MHFTPHTDEERRQMLDAIGIESLEELFRDLPGKGSFPQLDLPPALSEMEVASELGHLAARNATTENASSFLGAGCYRHFIPATVDYVLQRGEFYTSYTPYQPELSQGMLQAMFEYQSMICRLTDMEVSNASHYDGSTSLAEAALLAFGGAKEGRSHIIVSPSVHPHYREVLATYLRGADAELIIPDDPSIAATDLLRLIDSETAALVVQSPNFFGRFEELEGVAEATHSGGALLIVVTDPISLGLFKPPGAYGADVVVADGQPLGLQPAFGGPSLGVFATRREHIRHLVGRLVGQTTDLEGQRGFVLTLATREQHIRRAKATSNICTNSALGALAAATYLATLGKHGLRRIAELCFQKSHYAATKIGEIPGFEVNPDAPSIPFFKEFVVSLPCPAAHANDILREKHGIIGGYDLGQSYPGQDERMLLAVTEMNTREEIDCLAAALRSLAL